MMKDTIPLITEEVFLAIRALDSEKDDFSH